MRATVAIPVKDRREQMGRCLDAVLAQRDADYEVLVLDNGSRDGTFEACLARAADAPVPVRVERVQGTVGRVRNAGARLAAGEVIAFTDSDCEPDPGWLAAGLAALAADARVGVACGRTVPAAAIVEGWPATIRIEAMTWRFESCNVFYRREALRAAAGFDEAGYGWEDAAAGWSVLDAGWRAAFVPEALVRHDVTYPGFAWHLRRQRQHRYAAGVLRRHPSARRALWARAFIHRGHAELLLAALGVALAPRRPAAVALALPYAFRRRLHDRTDLRAKAQATLYDAAGVAAAGHGALRARTPVL